ncbi:class I SAM-dependent methyltransferase [Oculatella sp. LEGE 06141]|uniref:class I SAM-dependent methyltransferase n=1 Tax=Oculatella sp. LEGE 06141 TaxID=1828648 RepID=UPI00187FB9BA|nr:class I SAM-dependent methyltransferase [Oculatella sp. LEGE 06141]MBE9177800.1 class I SAM-dependent methyltransferase [Oculatella sp. LEGE 06141]
MEKWYKEDLAYIHDVGHSDYALKSAPGILEILDQNSIREGLVVDLGCGSGVSALELTKAHYHVLGIDISESLITIARTRVPNAEFRVESLFKAHIPTCSVVISIGECFNYLFDADNNWQTLVQLFNRIYTALMPGGVFIFDIAEPGQVPEGYKTKSFTEGDDWMVLVEKEEDREQSTLMRRIITLRKTGIHYRRDDEVHYLRLYRATDIAERLGQVGFQTQVMNSYGHYELPKAHTAFIARKPM